VNLTFTEEHEELRSTVRQFLAARSDEQAVRQHMASERGWDPGVWKLMAEQIGLAGLIVPEEYGGAGFGPVELCVVMEEMGRALACAPYLATAVGAASALLECGDAEARSELLPAIAAGRSVSTLAWVEPDGRWDLSGIAMRARPKDGGWLLDGRKCWVLDGHTADPILVAARTEAGLELFRVDADADGLTRSPLPELDLTRKLADLEFSATPAAKLGHGDRTAALERVLALCLAALAAEQVGGAQACLDMATAYARSRLQFGRPIGSYQAIKHKCADLLVEVEFARTAAYHACFCAAQAPDELPEAAALAKAYCSEVYFHAAAENIQIHGGMGFTWEHPAHLYFKRAKSSQALFGSPVAHRERLAEHIGL
jgi:alkylation response protein AidB-like acyl-CoA dehydrogenase